MADFGDELVGIGKAIPAAFQGYYDMKHFQAREREEEAKLKTQEESKRRQVFLDRLAAKKAGYLVPDDPNQLYSGSLERDPDYVDRDKVYKNLQLANMVANMESKGYDLSGMGGTSEPQGLVKAGLIKPASSGFLRLTPEAEEGKRLDLDTKRARLKNEQASGQKMTDVQGNAISFGKRAAIADDLINQLEQDPNFDVSSYKTQLKSSLPKWMGGTLSGNEQVLQNAKLSFVASVLRKESGAAVTPGEFAQYDKIYFPQPGDTDQVRRIKSRLRQEFIETQAQIAGPNWKAPQTVSLNAGDSNTPKPPKPGAVDGGYRFKGGNPGDRKNWEKVK